MQGRVPNRHRDGRAGHTMYLIQSAKPHAGLRSFHQKSTCLHANNFRAIFEANLVTSPPYFGGPETLVVHRVVRWEYRIVCKAHRPVYHSTPGLRVIKKKRRRIREGCGTQNEECETRVIKREREYRIGIGKGEATSEWSGGNVQRFRGGLVLKADRLYVSLNSRLESNQEEDEWECAGEYRIGIGKGEPTTDHTMWDVKLSYPPLLLYAFTTSLAFCSLKLLRQALLVFKAHRLVYHSTLGLREIKRERERARARERQSDSA